VTKPANGYVFTVPRTLQEDPEGRQVHHLFLSTLVVSSSHIMLQVTLKPLKYNEEARCYQQNQLFTFLPLLAD